MQAQPSAFSSPFVFSSPGSLPPSAGSPFQFGVATPASKTDCFTKSSPFDLSSNASDPAFNAVFQLGSEDKSKQVCKQSAEGGNAALPIPVISNPLQNTVNIGSLKAEKKKQNLLLNCISGPYLGQSFSLTPKTELGADIFYLGRNPGFHFQESGIKLYNDAEISKLHVQIELKHGDVFLMDMKSSNGTLLNGIKMNPLVPMQLNEGDVIKMGITELKVCTTDFVVPKSSVLSPLEFHKSPKSTPNTKSGLKGFNSFGFGAPEHQGSELVSSSIILLEQHANMLESMNKDVQKRLTGKRILRSSDYPIFHYFLLYYE
jgi:hypothetical protein